MPGRKDVGTTERFTLITGANDAWVEHADLNIHKFLGPSSSGPYLCVAVTIKVRPFNQEEEFP